MSGLIIIISCAVFSSLMGLSAFAVPGDVNKSNSVDIIDALLVAQYSAGVLASLPDMTAGDVDCDEAVGIDDALVIARHAAAGTTGELTACVSRYPLTFHAFSADVVANTQRIFDNLNRNSVYSVINQFGLCGQEAIPYSLEPVGGALTDESEVLKVARAALIKNSQFTNVTEATPLNVRRVIHVSGFNWTIEYACGIYKGIKMDPLYMYVKVNQTAYAIRGYYPPDNIIIPKTENISLEQAKINLLGKVIVFYNIAGEPVEYTITESSLLSTTAQKAIIPVETTDTLTFRYCWEVLVEDGMWYAYVDVMTGELIKTEQNFQT